MLEKSKIVTQNRVLSFSKSIVLLGVLQALSHIPGYVEVHTEVGWQQLISGELVMPPWHSVVC